MRRILSRSLLVSVVGSWFYYWWNQQCCQNPGDGRFRAYNSWQYEPPVDEEQ